MGSLCKLLVSEYDFAPCRSEDLRQMSNRKSRIMLTIDEVKPLVKKVQIAKTLACSPRQVDNYMADGMPHQKPSPRKVTFDTAEVLKWYKERFGLQRRKLNCSQQN